MKSNLKKLSLLYNDVHQIETALNLKNGKAAASELFAAAELTESPATLTIGSDVFKAWFAQLSSTMPVTLAVQNAQTLAIHCQDLREQLRKMPMPAPIDTHLRRQILTLCQHGPVSIRSLTTLENKLGALVNTANDTFFEIVGVDAVVDCVIDCYVSLWEERAVKYRSDQGVDSNQISIVVTVKEMIG